MADVFLSYSSKDRAMAALVERALTSAGYDVFWDQETPVATDWNTWIGGKLRDARVAIVLWSKTSVASDNVVHEATIAKSVHKLIPAVIETLNADEFPMGFYTLQGADLRGYRSGDHPGMAKLLAAVAEKLGGRTPAHGAPGRAGAGARGVVSEESKGKRRMLIVGGVLAAGFLAMAMIFNAVSISRDRQAALVAASKAAPASSAAPAPTGAAGLVGDWRWTGLACGQGPHIAGAGDVLVVTMAGAPTYRHAIDRAEAGALHTIVIEPESDRGQEYVFTRSGGDLSVKNVASGQVDTWEICP